MVCGGFVCSKNALGALNTLFMLVGLLLIGVAAYGAGFGIISSISVVGGVISVGFFLFLVSIVGLVGAVKHHQVLLFFYMVILVPMFIVQLGVSCTCLALNENQQDTLLELSWANANNKTREDVQKYLQCCGFTNTTEDPLCAEAHPNYTPCSLVFGKSLDGLLRAVGGIGLFFAFSLLLGLWLTHRYRNQKDPRGHSGAFL
ncbi:tetraspanin-31-like [Lethenteron reissneri]|uniref:tetraspanin-31-like n=1 Tax=Lethenteron reissneri TaxID=7753 RepID=UPI002AB7DEE1|nr:tetraspanin-31-like [Lethenteron reissneri]